MKKTSTSPKSINLREVTSFGPSDVAPAQNCISSESSKFKRFEHLAAAILYEVTPDCVITKNERLLAKKSGVYRQVDALIRSHLSPSTAPIIIEAKDHGRPVDITVVDQAIGLLNDIDISSAMIMIIAANGFTKKAKLRAKSAGIQLKSIIDTHAHEWQRHFTIPAACEVTQLDSCTAILRTPGVRLPVDPGSPEFSKFLLVHDGNSTALEHIAPLIINSFCDSKADFAEGTNPDFRFWQDELYLQNPEMPEQIFPATLSISLEIIKRRVCGDLPLAHAHGILDELTQYIQACFSVTGQDLDLDRLIPTWTETPNGAKPLLTVDAIGVAPELQVFRI